MSVRTLAGKGEEVSQITQVQTITDFELTFESYDVSNLFLLDGRFLTIRGSRDGAVRFSKHFSLMTSAKAE